MYEDILERHQKAPGHWNVKLKEVGHTYIDRSESKGILSRITFAKDICEYTCNEALQ